MGEEFPRNRNHGYDRSQTVADQPRIFGCLLFVHIDSSTKITQSTLLAARPMFAHISLILRDPAIDPRLRSAPPAVHNIHTLLRS
jgi:hypothetical protein